MKIHPMIFNAEMVTALVNGTKTVKRTPIEKWRVPALTNEPYRSQYPDGKWISIAHNHHRYGFSVFGATEEAVMDNFNDDYRSWAQYQKGDLIWVRETFRIENCYSYDSAFSYLVEYTANDYVLPINPSINKDGYDNNDYLAFAAMKKGNIRSIHMPRWASRLTLRVTNVRCERIQDITDEGAVKEGMPSNEQAQKLAINAGLTWFEKSRIWYKNLWNRIYKNWDENPWVWVIEFEVIHKNIDLVTREEKQ